MNSLNDAFKNSNTIIFDITHLSADEKRKEIEKYNPLFYIFGFTLISKPWLTYEEMYAISD
jgi:hypothetical protein